VNPAEYATSISKLNDVNHILAETDEVNLLSGNRDMAKKKIV
jgi:hypothetical protein